MEVEEEEFEMDGEEEEKLDANGAYTLRKISLKCLERISTYLGSSTFQYIKNYLKSMWESDCDLKKEAAFCILGSTGKFYFEELGTDFGALMSFALNSCKSNNQYLKYFPFKKEQQQSGAFASSEPTF